MSDKDNKIPLPQHGDTVLISKNHKGRYARGLCGEVWGFGRDGRVKVRIQAGWFASVLPENLTVVKAKNGKGV